MGGAVVLAEGAEHGLVAYREFVLCIISWSNKVRHKALLPFGRESLRIAEENILVP